MRRYIVLLLATAMLLGGCSGQQARVQETIFAMDTVMQLDIRGRDSNLAATRISELLVQLEQTWSVTREDSLLSALNRGQGVPDARQQALLDQAEAFREWTGGTFDPKLHSLLSLWGFRSREYRVPTAMELETARKTPQWDLGGILKGYAGECAVALLAELEIDGAILSLGGNVQTFGRKPDGRPWIIAIESPSGGEPVGQVQVQGSMAVVTSGDYQRYFEHDGKRYHHILDPATGCPAESGLASVTILCDSGTKADALSTALFVMGLADAVAFWRENGGFEAVFIQKDGSVLATEGAGFSGCAFEVITYEN